MNSGAFACRHGLSGHRSQIVKTVVCLITGTLPGDAKPAACAGSATARRHPRSGHAPSVFCSGTTGFRARQPATACPGFLPDTQRPHSRQGAKRAYLAAVEGNGGDMRDWLAVRGDTPALELFVNARGLPMTRSGFEYILQKHVKTAAQACASLQKKGVSPHVLRHTSAMLMLQATGDIRRSPLVGS